MRKLYPYLKRDLPLALLGVIFIAGTAYFELYQIQLMSSIIDEGIAQANFGLVKVVGWKMVRLALISIVLAVLGLVIPAYVSNRFAFRLRKDLFEKVRQFSLNNIQKFSTSTLVTRLNNDVRFLQRTLMMMLRLLVRAPVFLIASVWMTGAQNKEAALVMFVAVLILSLMLQYIIKKGFPLFVNLQKRLDDLNRVIQESLMNIRLIKAFVREDFERDHFDEENNRFYDANIQAHLLMAMMEPSLIFILNFATVFLLFVASHLIVRFRAFQVGDLLVFVNYLRFTVFSMMMLTHGLMMVSRSRASLVRINELLDEEITITSNEESLVSQIEGHIVFEDVCFSYHPDSAPVLRNLNFEIFPGDKVGVIGSTGSGKSTLMSLILRLYDIGHGSIKIDGQSIEDYELKFLRDQIAIVPQNSILFKGDLRSNLKMGNAEASDREMYRALEIANMLDYVQSSPDGLDEKVEQGGQNFSGGQKQRLSIARAWLKNAPILVLDDSTSALDAQTEAEVIESIYRERPQMTVINIAQKISSVRNSDQIFVLDDGMIVGQGKHEELIKDCQVYREICETQMRKAGDSDE